MVIVVICNCSSKSGIDQGRLIVHWRLHVDIATRFRDPQNNLTTELNRSSIWTTELKTIWQPRMSSSLNIAGWWGGGRSIASIATSGTMAKSSIQIISIGTGDMPYTCSISSRSPRLRMSMYMSLMLRHPGIPTLIHPSANPADHLTI